MNMWRHCIWMIAAVLLLCQCGKPTEPPQPYLITDSARVVKVDSLMTANVTWVAESYPEWVADSINAALVDIATGLKGADLKEAVRVALDSFQQMEVRDRLAWEADLPAGDEGESFELPPYGREIVVKQVEGTDLYYNFLITDYSYQGGAHGSYAGVELSIDKQSGHVLTWTDLFGTYASEGLLQKVRSHLVTDYFEGDDEAIFTEDMGPFGLPECPPYLTAEGVGFQYQQYEIAAYAYGLPCCVISYDELGDLLQPSFRERLQAPAAAEAAETADTTLWQKVRTWFTRLF